MADCRFLSRFTLTADDNELRIDHSVDGELNVTIAAGNYWWSMDEGSNDFAQALQDDLDDESTTVTWSVDVIGVSLIDTGSPTGAIRISCSSGTFTVMWSESADTTIDPRILGESATQSVDIASTGTDLTSTFAHRFGWYPIAPTQDSAPQSSELTISQARSTLGYISTVYFSAVAVAPWAVNYVIAARVSLACADQALRAANAGLATGDPNAPFEAFWIDGIQGLQIRHYADLTAYTANDRDGPYLITLGGAPQHNSLEAAVRPMPGKADLYNVAFATIEAL